MGKREVVLCLIGLLCLIYGVIIYRVQSGTAMFLIWFLLGVFFLILAVGVHFQFRQY